MCGSFAHNTHMPQCHIHGCASKLSLAPLLIVLALVVPIQVMAGRDEPPATPNKPSNWKDGQVAVTWREAPVKRQDFEVTVPVAPAAAWQTLTTVEGLQRFFPCKPTVEMRPGGLYDIHGETDNRVLTYITNELLAVTGSAPKQFPEVRKAHTTAIITFTPIGEQSTRIQMSCIGWKEGAEWDQAFEYFLRANAQFLNMLHAHLSQADKRPTASNAGSDTTAAAQAAPRSLRKEAVISATPEDIYQAFTTTEGIKTFFAPDGNVECKPGGPYEIYFAPKAAPGVRGSDGCKMLAFLPNDMVSFSWRAPASMPEAREGPATHVVVRIMPIDAGRTRVALVQEGWGKGGEWDEVYKYSHKAWDYVLNNLQKRFSKGPIDWSAQQKAEPPKTRSK